jgi:hypothetical protein
MNRINFRIFVGGALILLGALMLLQRFNIFSSAVDIFWGVLFLVGGLYFLYRFAIDMRTEWWAVIPGCALIGVGASIVLPGRWSGFAFLSFLGISFLAVYIASRKRWWAIIPGGVLITLGVIAVLADVYGARETGGLLFLGLGLTFLLVAVLSSRQWAYIPGVILLLMGAVLGYTPMAGSLGYVWPAVLILVGGVLIFQFTRPR